MPFVLAWPVRPDDRARLEALTGVEAPARISGWDPLTVCSLCRLEVFLQPHARETLAAFPVAVRVVCPFCVIREEVPHHPAPGL